MRGKRRQRTHRPRQTGLIPAYAGKTGRCPSASPQRGAHPRVCGENYSSYATALDKGGSSPRMRGKPRLRARLCRSSGLIPAYAGKTASADPDLAAVGAHPRVCGENVIAFASWVFTAGSSPRMRGKPPQSPPLQMHSRLIPAYAGKTRMSWKRISSATAHPRVCGENAIVPRF